VLLGGSSFNGKSFFRSHMSMASKDKATSVPPMPTMSIVNPNEKLSISTSLGLLVLEDFKQDQFPRCATARCCAMPARPFTRIALGLFKKPSNRKIFYKIIGFI
jgi:hypothetical protein